MHDLRDYDGVLFLFDVEKETSSAQRQGLRQFLEKSGKCEVRLGITSGCVELWFLLHFQQYAKPVVTPADKKSILDTLLGHVPQYEKGERGVMRCLGSEAADQKAAIDRATRLLHQTERHVPASSTPDLMTPSAERNDFLLGCDTTFTTLHEIVKFLEEQNGLQ